MVRVSLQHKQAAAAIIVMAILWKEVVKGVVGAFNQEFFLSTSQGSVLTAVVVERTLFP